MQGVYDARLRTESLSRIACIGCELLHCCHQVHSSASMLLVCVDVLCCGWQVEELRKELRNARVRSESLSGVAKDKNAKIRVLEEQLALTVTSVKVGGCMQLRGSWLILGGRWSQKHCFSSVPPGGAGVPTSALLKATSAARGRTAWDTVLTLWLLTSCTAE